MTILLRGAAAGLFLACLALPAQAAEIDLGMLKGARVMLPAGPATTTVFLVSGAAGWSEEDRIVAREAVAGGAAVVGIDLPTYIRALEKDDGDCVYLVSDIESANQQIARATGSTVFRPPVIAGHGAGGALVIDILAQTPPATIGAAVAVDPELGVGVAKQFCTPAERVRTAEGASYVLPAGDQPAPLSVLESAVAGSDSRAKVQALTREGVTFTLTRAGGTPARVLARGIAAALAAGGAGAVGLPITELPARPNRDTMAIVLSGDGGWRDLDRSIAEVLQAEGVPTVGLDSLHYFWSKRTPEETARDLARIIDTYAARWQVGRVLLVGYSFGADVLPATIAKLPPAAAARVVQVSLLGVSPSAGWEISVEGWLGKAAANGTPTAPALAALDPSLVQCVYGKDEEDSACPGLAGSGAEIVETQGGHHFDGDYTALAHRILGSLDRRLAAAAAAPAASAKGD